jgi:hypothetical protein
MLVGKQGGANAAPAGLAMPRGNMGKAATAGGLKPAGRVPKIFVSPQPVTISQAMKVTK